MDKNRRRITVKYKSANPLFEQWLNEWKTDAEAKDSKLKYTYKLALSSIRQCPIPFNSGKECKILKGFGTKLCQMLDDKLKRYNSDFTENSNDMDTGDINIDIKETNLSPSSENISNENNLQIKPKISRKKESKVKKIPCQLQKQTSSSSMEETSENSQEIKVSVTKGKSRKITKHVSNTSEESSQNCQDFFVMEPGNFDIILYIDTQETGNHSQRKTDPFLKQLDKQSGECQYEIKKLNVGDYVWICRDKTSKKELVLPYIFERKRLDDFSRSITDGRYKEQKFRLKKCGIENIYYLLENYSHHGLPLTTLQQAAFNTAIHDGFKIKMTAGLTHTAKLLLNFSSLLKRIFEKKTLFRCEKESIASIDLNDDVASLMSFTDFNKSSIKNRPMMVTDLFIKMLIQIRGMSVAKAVSITELYPTPMLLRKAYDDCVDEVSREKLLECIMCGNRKLGSTLSNTVHQLFNFTNY
ncbi:crossover junction endonuclease MUS81 [Diabrotica undecimpunctata]|uniref:crossover junction endonuclease MUS81 n=1 Tax=Diabrotica undecimpunctata TaxID=50387 RepID=UPI003B639193